MDVGLVLDLAAAAVLFSYAWSGWRQGFVTAALGLTGLLAGGYLALRFAPGLLEKHAGVDLAGTAGVLVAVVVVLLVASMSQWVMLVLGSSLRRAVRLEGYRVLDSLLGMVAVVAATLFVLWAVAGAVRTSGPATLRVAVGESLVVRAADALVPDAATGLVDEATRALDRSGFPRVFEGLGPEPIVEVAAPDAALAADPDVRRALASVVRVRSDAPRCNARQVGSGWVSARGRVVTNAHVVAGATRVWVQAGGRGPEREARVIAFDPDRDVAVLAVAGLRAPPLKRGARMEPQDQAVLAGFPGDDGLRVGAARVRDLLDARGADIYGQTGPTRSIYSLRAVVRQGASGGPVLSPEGEVVGMVFATSLDDPQTGYALTPAEVDPVLRRAASASGPVSTRGCAVG